LRKKHLKESEPSCHARSEKTRSLQTKLWLHCWLFANAPSRDPPCLNLSSPFGCDLLASNFADRSWDSPKRFLVVNGETCCSHDFARHSRKYLRLSCSARVATETHPPQYGLAKGSSQGLPAVLRKLIGVCLFFFLSAFRIAEILLTDANMASVTWAEDPRKNGKHVVTGSGCAENPARKKTGARFRGPRGCQALRPL
jgi:hypothetical protein